MSKLAIPLDVRRYTVASFLPLEDIDNMALLQQEIRKRDFMEVVDFIVEEDNPEHLEWLLEIRRYPETAVEIIAEKAIRERKPAIIDWLFRNDFDVLRFYYKIRREAQQQDIELYRQYPSVYEFIMLDPETMLPIFVDNLQRMAIWYRGYTSDEEGIDNIVQMHLDIAKLTGFVTDNIITLVSMIAEGCPPGHGLLILKAYLTTREGRNRIRGWMQMLQGKDYNETIACIAKDEVKRRQLLSIVDLFDQYQVKKSTLISQRVRDIWRGISKRKFRSNQ